MMRFISFILLTWAIPTGAIARTVTVIAPIAEGQGAAPVAADLGVIINTELIQSEVWTARDDILQPEELSMLLECAPYDARCAQKAAKTAQTDAAIYAKVSRTQHGLRIDLGLLPAEGSGRILSREIRLQGNPQAVRSGIKLALRAMGKAVLGGEQLDGAGVVLTEPIQAKIEQTLLMAPGVTLFLPGTYQVNFSGRASVQVALAPETFVVLEIPPPPIVPAPIDPAPIVTAPIDPVGIEPASKSNGLRIAAWMGVGITAVSLAGVGYMGARLSDTQARYDQSNEPRELFRHRDTGKNYATIGNTFLITAGVVALATGALFWLD